MDNSINTNKILAVVGSRKFDSYPFLYEKLQLHKPKMIVSGGAFGADSMSQKFAQENGLSILIYYPDWKGLGKSAGFVRNTKIVEYCEELVAFPVFESRGTMDSVNKAKKLGKKVYIYEEIGE